MLRASVSGKSWVRLLLGASKKSPIHLLFNCYVFFWNYQLGVDKIKIEVPSTKYDEDQTLRVTCFMVCKGIMLGWYKDGRPLSSARDPRVNITFARENDRTSTVLVVERLLANDSGIYTCEAIDCITGQPANTSESITINSKLGYMYVFR